MGKRRCEGGFVSVETESGGAGGTARSWPIRHREAKALSCWLRRIRTLPNQGEKFCNKFALTLQTTCINSIQAMGMLFSITPFVTNIA